MSARIRVLIVDDSAFARKVLRECLEADPAIEVIGTARDGLDALERISALAPDVVTLDMMMPNLDGIGVLTALPPSGPRVVICSTADEDSAGVVHALSIGAVTSVHKPTALATDRMYEMRQALVDAVKLAASARTSAGDGRSDVLHAPPQVKTGLVVIGASTGGPQAITRILRALPADFPVPVALVVHMPVGYTEGFAARLNDHCAIAVAEASDGAALRPGRVLVGRAGVHLRVHAGGGSVVLDPRPTDVPHRPSVDVLFATAGAAFGTAALGVILTGMGDDGLVGARAMVAAGGRVIGQSASSCVVYGMPRVIAEAGLATAVVGLDEMAATIVRML